MKHEIECGRTTILAAVLVAVALLGWRGTAARAADAITDDNVDAAAAAAKTPEDHAALAAFFMSKAEAATASAERHDQMAKSFAPSKSMASHCRDLAAADRKQAADYTALAKAQDALAKGKTIAGGPKHHYEH
jgi:hypothetical protein